MLASMDHPLKVARKNAGLNQAQVAELAKTTQSAISKYESGEVIPSVDAAAAIAQALGMSELQLLYPERFGFVRERLAA